MEKEFYRRINKFFRVLPSELESLDEWAEYLDSLRKDPV